MSEFTTALQSRKLLPLQFSRIMIFLNVLKYPNHHICIYVYKFVSK